MDYRTASKKSAMYASRHTRVTGFSKMRRRAAREAIQRRSHACGHGLFFGHWREELNRASERRICLLHTLQPHALQPALVLPTHTYSLSIYLSIHRKMVVFGPHLSRRTKGCGAYLAELVGVGTSASAAAPGMCMYACAPIMSRRR